jgi:hypothetical protein
MRSIIRRDFRDRPGDNPAVDVNDFRKFLAGGHRVTPPGNGRAAIRGWLSLQHVGNTLSLHQRHALVGGQRLDLAPWVLAFLEVSDRLPAGDVSHDQVLDSLERAAWDPDAVLRELKPQGA